jgi:ribosomal protein L11 methyltransferase
MEIKPRRTRVASLQLDEQPMRRIAALADEGYCAGVAVDFNKNSDGSWRVLFHVGTPRDEKSVLDLVAAAAGSAAAAALGFDTVEAADWVRNSLAGLAPVSAGRFIVHGSHDRAGIPANRIGIEIEAALAFGTGHHGTTRGCLLALDRLCKTSNRRRHVLRVLDLGTGSGVLAIAAARALHRKVLATDIDVSAVRVARANARLNRVGAAVKVVKADGVAAPDLRRQAPFDLVFANILLGPLLRLGTPLRQLTAAGGRVVLSGIVPSQANAAIAAYRPFALERRLDLDGWTTLVLVRRATHSLGVAGRVRAS